MHAPVCCCLRSGAAPPSTSGPSPAKRTCAPPRASRKVCACRALRRTGAAGKAIPPAGGLGSWIFPTASPAICPDWSGRAWARTSTCPCRILKSCASCAPATRPNPSPRPSGTPSSAARTTRSSGHVRPSLPYTSWSPTPRPPCSAKSPKAARSASTASPYPAGLIISRARASDFERAWGRESFSEEKLSLPQTPPLPFQRLSCLSNPCPQHSLMHSSSTVYISKENELTGKRKKSRPAALPHGMPPVVPVDTSPALYETGRQASFIVHCRS